MFKIFLKEYDKIKIGTGLYILLYFLTCSIYPAFQTGRVQVVLNKIFNKEIINTSLIYFTLVLVGISFYITIGEQGNPTETTDAIVGLLWIVNYIIFIVISFNISKEFEFLIIKEKIKLPESLKFNPFLLILLNFIYINYKFNQFLELELKK
jgi:hypothetical protein